MYAFVSVFILIYHSILRERMYVYCIYLCVCECVHTWIRVTSIFLYTQTTHEFSLETVCCACACMQVCICGVLVCVCKCVHTWIRITSIFLYTKATHDFRHGGRGRRCDVDGVGQRVPLSSLHRALLTTSLPLLSPSPLSLSLLLLSPSYSTLFGNPIKRNTIFLQ